MRAESDLEALMAVFTLGMSVYTGRVVALWYPPKPRGQRMAPDMEKAFQVWPRSCSFAYRSWKYPGCFTSALLVRSRNAPERKARSSANDRRGQGGAHVSCIRP
jgi:hypothetical protein